MIELIVTIRVRPEAVEAWKAHSLANVAASRLEKGILAFDLLADRADPTRFALVEKYEGEEAIAAHKATAHYRRWCELAEPLQAEPRSRALYDPMEP